MHVRVLVASRSDAGAVILLLVAFHIGWYEIGPCLGFGCKNSRCLDIVGPDLRICASEEGCRPSAAGSWLVERQHTAEFFPFNAMAISFLIW